MTSLGAHLFQHRLFYMALMVGVAAATIAFRLSPTLIIPIGGDAFYATYLLLIGRTLRTLTSDRLRVSAATEDEGTVFIAIITLAAVSISVVSIFTLLNSSPTPDATRLALALSAAPLGWFVLHTIAAFHYSHHYYGGEGRTGAKPHGLKFPGRREPGIWDFIYFAFVIGMTAQTADVDIQSTWIRRRATAHGIISFIFNTVLLAMAVNVVVTLIEGR